MVSYCFFMEDWSRTVHWFQKSFMTLDDLRRKRIGFKWSNFKTNVKQKSCFDAIYSEQVFDGFCWFQRWLFPEQTFVCSVHWSLLMYQCRSIVCRTFLLELNVYFFVCRTLVEMPYVIPQYVQINYTNMCCFFLKQGTAEILWFIDLSYLFYWNYVFGVSPSSVDVAPTVVLSLNDAEQGSWFGSPCHH